ncbi:hypothetical protein [Nocardiopsis salina]|uniref:hypothetical protein n=1 Tax=Nocardiopsis salina TaxID=245836 RepID=UPI0003466F98|nr:hypothetical protein [Nocardiopsis salina]
MPGPHVLTDAAWTLLATLLRSRDGRTTKILLLADQHRRPLVLATTLVQHVGPPHVDPM